MNNKDIWSPMHYYLAGWRSDDGADLMETFGMTYEQACKICDELKIIEDIAKSNAEVIIE